MGLRTIADHIMDIAQNAVKVGAKNIKIYIDEVPEKTFKFVVEDDGPGMDEKTLSRIFDPFFTTRDPKIRKVGLGLPFLRQSAEATGGYVKLFSKPGKGTRVEALFHLDHVDCQPIGDLPSTFSALIFSNSNINWYIRRRKGNNEYELKSDTIRKILGNIQENPAIMKEVMNIIEELEKGLDD
ncbi:MAG TPA: ATP-binding protein [Thermotoga sp.]|nr:ATP-binding protein [Thermotoga sp.]